MRWCHARPVICQLCLLAVNVCSIEYTRYIWMQSIYRMFAHNMKYSRNYHTILTTISSIYRYFFSSKFCTWHCTTYRFAECIFSEKSSNIIFAIALIENRCVIVQSFQWKRKTSTSGVFTSAYEYNEFVTTANICAYIHIHQPHAVLSPNREMRCMPC